MGTGRACKRATVEVWDWTGEAVDEGDAAAEYLSELMGSRVCPHFTKEIELEALLVLNTGSCACAGAADAIRRQVALNHSLC